MKTLALTIVGLAATAQLARADDPVFDLFATSWEDDGVPFWFGSSGGSGAAHALVNDHGFRSTRSFELAAAPGGWTGVGTAYTNHRSQSVRCFAHSTARLDDANLKVRLEVIDGPSWTYVALRDWETSTPGLGWRRLDIPSFDLAPGQTVFVRTTVLDGGRLGVDDLMISCHPVN